jgi:hypothetical protein
MSIAYNMELQVYNFLFIPMCTRYEKSSRFMKEGYERDFLRYLQSLLAEVERRIRRGHARLALSQAQQAAGVRIYIDILSQCP